MALLGLLLVFPIIILYLLRPKPKHIRFPSVMFIINAEKSKRLRSFLKKIIRDPLLLLQMLLVGALVCAAAGPYFFTQEEQNQKETAVIVLDSSASMQASDVSPDRFTRAVAVARDIISRMNDESTVSIVLAENSPIILAKSVKRDSAASLLSSAFVSDAPSNIGDAVLFARDMFADADTNKKIYVLSDYAHPEGSDLLLVQKIASQSNVSVSFVRVNGEGRNVGIVDARVKRYVTDRNRFYVTFTVHNYFDGEKDVEAKVLLDDVVVATMRQKIGGGAEKLFTYEGNVSGDAHRVVLKLTGADSLSVDNTAYLYMPDVSRYRVLLITEEVKTGGAVTDQYLKYALESSKDIELTTKIPPLFISDFSGYDAVILGELNDKFLKQDLTNLRAYVQKGGHVVFVASQHLPDYRSNPDLKDMLPVSLGDVKNKTLEIEVLYDHEILSDVVPKGSSVFPSINVERYIQASNKTENVVAGVLGSPVIAFNQSGRGKVVYVGVNPSPGWSNFYYSSSFPVFWLQLINWVNRDEATLGVNNFLAGDYLPVTLDAETKTPSGKVLMSGNVILDEAGFYEVYRGGKTSVIAVSLLNEKESDISASPAIEAVDDKDLDLKKESVTVKKEFLPYLVAAALVFFLVEVYYYKRRGLL